MQLAATMFHKIVVAVPPTAIEWVKFLFQGNTETRDSEGGGLTALRLSTSLNSQASQLIAFQQVRNTFVQGVFVETIELKQTITNSSANRQCLHRHC
eukprot:3403071-Amphidinium_carterae.1